MSAKTLKVFITIFIIGCLSNNKIYALETTLLQKSYTWEFEGNQYTFAYSFKNDTYTYYKKLKRNYTNFSVYVFESKQYPVINNFAAQLKLLAQKNNLIDLQTVEFIAAFVQNLHYKTDGKYEYPRYPIETLVESGGDCEDFSILLDSILRSLGYSSVLVSPEHHMGVGVVTDKPIQNGMAFEYNNEKFYYIETTNTGWGIGQYPDQLSENVIIYDPGQLPNARAISINEKTQNNDFEETATTYNTKTNSSNSSSENKYTPKQTATNSNQVKTNNSVSKSLEFDPNKFTFQNASDSKSVDKIVVNGEKQTVITETSFNE